MAGTIIESQLTARPRSAIRFTLARQEDDPAIRRLLRQNPVQGAVTVSFEREPDYFHSTNLPGGDDKTFLAFQEDRLVCMGRCSVRDRYINGEARRVGYLSDLRLDASARGRFDVLRRGYQFFHELERDNLADFYFTSITADNLRSIRFLERGIPGMPLYEPLADFVTLLIPVPRPLQKLRRLKDSAFARLKSANIQIVSGSENHSSTLVDLLNSHAKQFNLVTRWNQEKLSLLQQHGLALSNFMILMNAGEVSGCAALWDQRSFKQTVIHRYSRSLSLVRPLLNIGSNLLGHPGLPTIGTILAHGFLSPLAVALDDKRGLLAIIDASLLSAAERGLEFLSLGFAANDQRLATVRRHYRFREYKNRLFQVRWRDENRNRIILNERLIFPEIALL